LQRRLGNLEKAAIEEVEASIGHEDIVLEDATPEDEPEESVEASIGQEAVVQSKG
jgi:hypothetical protein